MKKTRLIAIAAAAVMMAGVAVPVSAASENTCPSPLAYSYTDPLVKKYKANGYSDCVSTYDAANHRQVIMYSKPETGNRVTVQKDYDSNGNSYIYLLPGTSDTDKIFTGKSTRWSYVMTKSDNCTDTAGATVKMLNGEWCKPYTFTEQNGYADIKNYGYDTDRLAQTCIDRLKEGKATAIYFRYSTDYTGTTWLANGHALTVIGYDVNVGQSKLEHLLVIDPWDGTQKTMADIFRVYSHAGEWLTFATSINTLNPLKFTFDPEVYYNMYPDLQAAFGYNEEALYNHWITCGISEGRTASVFFDVKYYLEHNSDVAAAFGQTNYSAAYKHFMQFGYKEPRAFSPVYDSTYYSNKYSDLRSLSCADLINHYFVHGLREGRQASRSFSPSKYKKYNADVAKAYKNDWTRYAFHYTVYGINENRKAS